MLISVRRIIYSAVISITVTGLIGCGGGSNGASNVSESGQFSSEDPINLPEDPVIEESTTRQIQLVSASDTGGDLTRLFQEALTEMNQVEPSTRFAEGTTEDLAFADMAPAPMSAAEDASSTQAQNDQFSTTNLQVANVDEADLMKFDGKYLYIASQKRTIDYAEAGIEPADPRPGPEVDPITEIATEAVLTTTETLSRSSIALPYQPPLDNSVRIMAVEDNPGSAVEINRIELNTLDKMNTSVKGLYLQENQLTLISGRQNYYGWYDYAGWSQGTIQATTYDVEEPTNVALTQTLEIEGTLLGSRRIGDDLILITRKVPYFGLYHYYPWNDEQVAQNQRIIDGLSSDDLLPQVRVDEEDYEPLYPTNRCKLPRPIQSDKASLRELPTLISVTRVSLSNFKDRESLCVAANSQGFYMSTEALYLFGSRYWGQNGEETLIHKFSLKSDEESYRGSGRVPGLLGHLNPEYRLGEKDGALIVVTDEQNRNFWPWPIEPVLVDDVTSDTITEIGSTVADESVPPVIEGARHKLTVLKENPELGILEQVAQLPNPEQPTPIGKVGERIHGVRIMGNRAFIVTFERIDPLYVINIENPEQPEIEGALEIPGFSDYLHPINESLLLGIGKDTSDTAGPTLLQGLKVALFNVADPNNPMQMASLSIGGRGTDSAALRDPKAFTSLRISDSTYRFTLPITYYAPAENPSNIWAWGKLEYSGLALFEVVGDLGNAEVQLVDAGRIKRKENNEVSLWHYSTPLERSLLLNNSVHYVSGEQVWSADWFAPDLAVGPQ